MLVILIAAGLAAPSGGTDEERKDSMDAGRHGATSGALDHLRLDATGAPKPPDAPVFSNAVGEPIHYFSGMANGHEARERHGP